MDQFELLLVYRHPSQQAGLGNVPKCTVPACTSNLSAIAAEAMVVDAPDLTTALTLQMDPLDDPFLFSRCRVQNDGGGRNNFYESGQACESTSGGRQRLLYHSPTQGKNTALVYGRTSADSVAVR